MLKTAMFRFDIALFLLVFALFMPIAQAGTKCEPDSRGGFCCWDVERDGIFKPISCA
jgi:hypothetical protein